MQTDGSTENTFEGDPRFDLNAKLDRYCRDWVSGDFSYQGFDASEEEGSVRKFRSFISTTPECFDSDHYEPGHVTGSALVVDPSLTKVLLTLHGKLHRWLQLGGHADGHPATQEVALREAHEESGLAKLEFLDMKLGTADSPMPFDLDVHDIPAKGRHPAHRHYDVRYLIVANPADRIAISDESHDLRWFTVEEARGVVVERSMHRQFDKVCYLRERFQSVIRATP